MKGNSFIESHSNQQQRVPKANVEIAGVQVVRNKLEIFP